MGTYNSVISFFDFLNIRSPKIWHGKICFGLFGARPLWHARSRLKSFLREFLEIQSVYHAGGVHLSSTPRDVSPSSPLRSVEV